MLTALAFPALVDAQFTQLAPLPEPVSNNAVAAAQLGGNWFIYSFAGIDTSKIWSGIHLKSWRYDVAANEWTPLPDVPDPNGGKIAAGASTVQGKIYLIGGYHVAQNGGETSSAKTHVFDPMTNTWLPDAADLPVPIDDQVQAVWRDSLIYVVTGWSNTTNVANVQVFNPSVNEWAVGTPVPNSVNYKVFGGSGVIIGDTIFYAGGARSSFNFPASTFFRKGVINPANPTEIEWTDWNEPASQGYRMAAATAPDGNAVWLGGSDVTYNFDGIAYNGSGGVAPLDRITLYSPSANSFFQTNGQMPAVMDFRGAAQIAENEVILAGGMEAGQQVTARTWRISLDNLTAVEGNVSEPQFFKIYPNPVIGTVTVEAGAAFEIEVYNASGKLLLHQSATGEYRFSTSGWGSGTYWVEIIREDGLRGTEQLMVD